MAGWILIIFEIYRGESSLKAKTDKNILKAFNSLRLIVLVGWSIYPVGYIFGFITPMISGNEINTNLSILNDQIKNINTHSKGIDEKLSNFLSTQLNTQSSILQLINKINEQGFLDNSTKKIFEDLNQSIQELKAKNKK